MPTRRIAVNYPLAGLPHVENINPSTQGKKMIHDINLSSRLLEIEDAADTVERTRVFIDLVRSELNDMDEQPDLAHRLLDCHEEKFDKKINELRGLIVSLRSELAEPQRPTLTLVG